MFFDVSTQADKQSILAFALTGKNAPIVVDEYQLHLTDKQFEFMSEGELVDAMGGVLLADVEVYPNYFLISFQDFNTGKVYTLEQTDGIPLDCRKLKWMLGHFCIVTFNGRNYDIPISLFALKGKTCAEIKAASDELISGVSPWNFSKAHNLLTFKINHVDLIEVAPLQGSLKLYAGRLHCKRMQDLPFDPNREITDAEKEELKRYNFNDLDNTRTLASSLSPQLELRATLSAQYRVDVRSKSDAQIAEHVIASELERINGSRPKRPEIAPGTFYSYQVPSWVAYSHPSLLAMLETVQSARFVVAEDGSVQMPEAIADLSIHIGQCVYRMGIGGLHSSEKSTAHIADQDALLIDRDVASYYPSIILNEELYPKHLGKQFLNVYRTIVERRLAAKRDGNKVVAESLKITINGSFGKLGSKWSCLYAPDLMLQVTLTGQLALLMLINMIEDVGIPVVSANTDGVLIKCPSQRSDALNEVIAQWERITHFSTEETRYKAVWSRDVNNYLALKMDGKFKGKGVYADESLQKNPETLVCKDAVKAYLSKGVPVEATITSCTDVRRFLTIRNVKGGAVKSGVYLGKTVRWYYSTRMQGRIEYAISGNKVANTDKAMPLMELPEALPDDIDYAYYIATAWGMLKELGVTDKCKQAD